MSAEGAGGGVHAELVGRWLPPPPVLPSASPPPQPRLPVGGSGGGGLQWTHNSHPHLVGSSVRVPGTVSLELRGPVGRTPMRRPGHRALAWPPDSCILVPLP